MSKEEMIKLIEMDAINKNDKIKRLRKALAIMLARFNAIHTGSLLDQSIETDAINTLKEPVPEWKPFEDNEIIRLSWEYTTKPKP